MPDTVGVPVLSRAGQAAVIASGVEKSTRTSADSTAWVQGIGDRYADPAGAGEVADILADT